MNMPGEEKIDILTSTDKYLTIGSWKRLNLIADRWTDMLLVVAKYCLYLARTKPEEKMLRDSTVVR